MGMGVPTMAFFQGSDDIDEAVKKLFYECKTKTDCLEKVANGNNYVFASSRLYAEQLIADTLLPTLEPGNVIPVRFLPIPIALPPIEMILIKVCALIYRIVLSCEVMFFSLGTSIVAGNKSLSLAIG